MGHSCPNPKLRTIYYIAPRQIGDWASLTWIAEVMSILGIAAVNQRVLAYSIVRGMPDFEDAVLHEAALQAEAHCIVTQNVTDFGKAENPVYTPGQFLAALAIKKAEKGSPPQA